MDDGALFLSLYVLSAIVMQAGVTCTSFLLTTQLESGDWRKRTATWGLNLLSASATACSLISCIYSLSAAIVASGGRVWQGMQCLWQLTRCGVYVCGVLSWNWLLLFVNVE